MEPGQDDFRVLFDASPRPMFVSDRETLKILEANRAACELYGWSRDELLGMTLRDIRPAEELASFEASYADQRKGPRYARVAKHQTKTGKVVDVTLEISTTQFRDRAVSLVLITDVTGIADVERRFQLLVEHSTDGIALTTAENAIEYVSPGGCRILGYDDASTIIGSRAGFAIHADDIAAWRPPAPGETKQALVRAKHRDGSWRWLESSTTNLTHDPAVRAYVTNYRDVTERVEAKQRLEFLLSATTSVTYTARDFKTTFVSANAMEVLGYHPEEFYADGFWYSRIHPDDVKLAHDALERLPSGPVTLEYRFLHGDGAYRWIRDNVRVIRGELVGCMIDITDAARAHEALRRSEHSFRTLIERAPIATFVHRDQHYVYVNSAAVALLGASDASEIVGKSILTFVHPDARESLRARLETLPSRTGESFKGMRLVRFDGTVFIVEGEAILLDFDGEPSHVVMCQDVTERDTAFARIALADRTLSIGTLAAGVAHEVNNPLAYIATNLELLAAELPHLHPSSASRLTDASLQRLVSDAREGVGRVNRIVRDLRSLSRPDDNEPGPVDVVKVLESSIKMTSNEIRHRARVIQEYDTDLPAVAGDPSRLGQVFINLLLNAAQAIVEGDADQNEIRVSANADGKRVRIDISDTGVGIPESIIGRIFDPFFTTKEPGSGTGLGLAISHQIIRSMGGEIRVESRAGEGSTFTLTLPAANNETREQVRERKSIPRFTRRVLIIDDEAAVGRSLEMLLAPETEVVAVVTAEEGLDQLVKGPPFDAILCDLMMPHTSGIQLYEQIEKVRPEYLPRIVFMTGGAFTPQAHAFLAKLDRPHLEKPFSEQEVRDAISRVIH